MVTRDTRIDDYIAKAADFAKPILTHIRKVVHEACPDVVETLKWGMPSFEYKGILCGMAAFKQHCAFGFWKHSLVFDGVEEKAREAMGSFGKLSSVEQLPSKRDLTAYIKKAMKLNEEGIKAPREKTTKDKKPAVMHPDFAAALKKNRKASATFEAFSPSHKKEYMEWISEAKQDATRQRRLKQAIEWLEEGKSRNWKYERC
ncbi:MAG: YdeI/OmpD-associated family protein [Planctomycetes bacterium]|nr:YdeI/OmpD-associated family protein [Planctomycetota bacterium]